MRWRRPGKSGDVDNQFGQSPQAAEAQEIPADQDPEADLKDFSSYVFIRVQGWVRRATSPGHT